MADETKDEVKEPKTVEISKVQFDGLLSRLEQLEKEKSAHDTGRYSKDEWREVEDAEQNRTATLRYLEGKYAIDLLFSKRMWNEKEQEKEFVYKVTFLLPNGKNEVVEMTLKDYALLERVEVKLIDKVSKKLEKTTGKTNLAKVDYTNYKTTTGKAVDMKVTAYQTFYTIELPDKRQIKLLEQRLNN